MPRFTDVHEKIDGLTAEAVAGAHARDLEVQGKYGASYLRDWFGEENGKVFCLVDAPDARTANKVHAEAHGLVADSVTQVQEGK
jgi:hypothetical protein